MEKLEQKENQITLKVEMEDSLANAIRRYLNHISVLAVDEVEIFKNDSPLYDETVAHRIGLIPLKMDKSVNDKTEMEMKLATKGEKTVYSGEFSGGLGVVYDKIPLTTLGEGSELQLVATARTGKGAEHSKFSPGLMFYRNVLEIKVDENLQEKMKNAFPGNKMSKEGKNIVILDDQKKEISDTCEEICKEEGKTMEVTPTKDLLITVESFGQLDTKEILKRAISILKKDLEEVSKKLK